MTAPEPAVIGYACARTMQVVWNRVAEFSPCDQCVPIRTLPETVDALAARLATAEEEVSAICEILAPTMPYALSCRPRDQVQRLVAERDAAQAEVQRLTQLAAMSGEVFAFAITDSKMPNLETRRQLHDAVKRALADAPGETRWAALDKHGHEVARFYSEDEARAYADDAQNGCAEVMRITPGETGVGT